MIYLLNPSQDTVQSWPANKLKSAWPDSEKAVLGTWSVSHTSEDPLWASLPQEQVERKRWTCIPHYNNVWVSKGTSQEPIHF